MTSSYVLGLDNVAVYVNGVKQSAVVNERAVDSNTYVAGNVQYTPLTDPVTTVQAQLLSLDAKVAETVSVKDFGAVGDGVADDTAEIQAALDAASVVSFPNGTYKITSGLVLNDGQIIHGNGSTLDATTMPTSVSLDDQVAILANGSVATPVAITANVTEGDTTITVADSSSFSVGDYVLLQSAQWYMDGVSSGTSLRGWVGKVSEVPNGTSLVISREAPTSLASASTATVSKITKKTVSINDLTINCGGVGEGHSGIRLEYNVGSKVKDVKVDAAEDQGVTVKSSTEVSVVRGAYTNCTSSATLGNTGYGVAFLNGTTFSSVKDSYFYNCRHSVSGGGILSTWYVDVVGCYSENSGLSTQDFDCHEPCFYWRFINNTSIAGADGSGGFVIRGQHTLVEGNTIRSSGSGIKVKTFIVNTDGVIGTALIGNNIISSNSGISLEGSSANGFLYKTVCSDNNITGTTFAAVTVTGCHTLNYSGGFIEGAGSKSFDVASTTFADMSEIHISDVVFGSSTEELVEADFVDGLTLSNLVGTVSMTSVFEINNSRRVQVRGCRAITTESFLVISDTDEIAVDSCRAEIQAGAGSWDFARINSTSSNTKVYIRDCQAFGVYRYGVYTTNYDTIIVTGCDFIDATNAIPINLSGAVTTVSANNLV
jgi:hypothetical protein